MPRRKIAKERELRTLLTAIARGEVDADQRQPTTADRLKAIDLLGKSTGLWGGHYREQRGNDVVFVGDELL